MASAETKSAQHEQKQDSQLLISHGSTATNNVHIQALDGIVSANSFFTIAVFIGLSFTTPGVQQSLVDSCKASSNIPKLLLVFEVIAFSSYLFSTLVAQGLKLYIVLLNNNDSSQVLYAPMNPNALRLGMLSTAAGVIVGGVFLTLSMVCIVEIRLGVLSCHESQWSKWAAIPMITLVSMGLFSFISTTLFAIII